MEATTSVWHIALRLMGRPVDKANYGLLLFAIRIAFFKFLYAFMHFRIAIVNGKRVIPEFSRRMQFVEK